jgi:hypothetical protein
MKSDIIEARQIKMAINYSNTPNNNNSSPPSTNNNSSKKIILILVTIVLTIILVSFVVSMVFIQHTTKTMLNDFGNSFTANSDHTIKYDSNPNQIPGQPIDKDRPILHSETNENSPYPYLTYE